MNKLILILSITALALIIAGCPPVEPDFRSDSFTGTVSFLDNADSLLSSVEISFIVESFPDDSLYTYQSYCDSSGNFYIYVGDHWSGRILYLKFSCEGYADQNYPVSTANSEIGEIILVPY